MSLRRELHSAFDDIAPALGGMPERVVQTVLAENNARRRKERMLFRMRTPLSLVAVFVFIALIAAALVGGRLVQDWNSFQTSPGVHAPKSELQQLEERPLRIPLYSSLNQCTPGPYNAESSLGSGPVFMDGGSSTVTVWGRYIYFDAYSDQQINGPILIRGRDLTKGIDMVFVGQFADGPVQGTDSVDGQSYEQRTEVVLSTSQTSAGGYGPISPHRYVWDFIGGLPAAGLGTGLLGFGAGWQIDGPNFTEILLAC